MDHSALDMDASYFASSLRGPELHHHQQQLLGIHAPASLGGGGMRSRTSSWGPSVGLSDGGSDIGLQQQNNSHSLPPLIEREVMVTYDSHSGPRSLSETTAEVDAGQEIRLSFSLAGHFSDNNILILSVRCMDILSGAQQLSPFEAIGGTTPHHSLSLGIFYENGEPVPPSFPMNYCAGEYSITLPCSTSRFREGRYIVVVQDLGYSENSTMKSAGDFYRNQGLKRQAINVSVRVAVECEARLLQDGVPTALALKLPSSNSFGGSLPFVGNSFQNVDNNALFFRFVCDDDRKLVRIKARIVGTLLGEVNGGASNFQSEDSAGFEIFATNHSRGLVKVPSASASWRSSKANSKSRNSIRKDSIAVGVAGWAQIDILPDDLARGHGGVFLIGLQHSGNLNGRNSEGSVTFEICAQAIVPEPIIELRPGRVPLTCKAYSYSFYSIDISQIQSQSIPGSLSRIVVSVTDPNSWHQNARNIGNFPVNGTYDYDRHALQSHFERFMSPRSVGRGIYLVDNLSEFSVVSLPGFVRTASAATFGINQMNAPQLDFRAIAESLTQPQVIPVIYVSFSCPYPTSECNDGRGAPGLDLLTGLLCEPSETLELAIRGKLYFSVYGHVVNEGNWEMLNNQSISRNNLKPYNWDSINNTSFSADSVSEAAVAVLSGLSRHFEICEYIHSEADGRPNVYLENLNLFNQVFHDIQGWSLSASDRAMLNQNNSTSLIYGESEYLSFSKLIASIQGLPRGQIFVDIGCGVGRAIAAASLSEAGFYKCVGIEILPSLASASREAITRLQSRVQLPIIEIKEGDALQIPWQDAQLVFFSSYCFDDELLHALFDRATLLRPGAMVLSFKLPSSTSTNLHHSNVRNWESLFKVQGQYDARFSWGLNRVWLLQRI